MGNRGPTPRPTQRPREDDMTGHAMCPRPTPVSPSARWSLALVSACAMVLVACSGTEGVLGPDGERLNTRVSATTTRIGDSVEVTLEVINPRAHPLVLRYGSRVTYAQVVRGDTTFAANVPLTGPDTIVLAEGSQTTLRPVTLRVLPRGVDAVPVPTPTSEPLTLGPGVYEVAACAWVSGLTPEGMAYVPACGPSVKLTVTS